MIEVTTPGKLFIAGEYAVVEPGHPAIIVAVDQFVTVTVEETTDEGSIQSANTALYLFVGHAEMVSLY